MVWDVMTRWRSHVARKGTDSFTSPDQRSAQRALAHIDDGGRGCLTCVWTDPPITECIRSRRVSYRDSVPIMASRTWPSVSRETLCRCAPRVFAGSTPRYFFLAKATGLGDWLHEMRLRVRRMWFQVGGAAAMRSSSNPSER